MLDEVPRAIEVDGVVLDVAAVRMAHSTLERDICFKIVNLPFPSINTTASTPRLLLLPFFGLLVLSAFPCLRLQFSVRSAEIFHGVLLNHSIERDVHYSYE